MLSIFRLKASKFCDLAEIRQFPPASYMSIEKHT
jgi:hypothetical protein